MRYHAFGRGCRPVAARPRRRAAAVARGADWVGLGDSFAAGPLIPNQSLSPLGCLRSDRNFARVAAGRDRHARSPTSPAAARRRRTWPGRRARARAPTRRSSTRCRPRRRSSRCRSAATTSASPRSSRTASPTTRSARPCQNRYGRGGVDQIARPDRGHGAEGRGGARADQVTGAERAHARRQLRRDPARDRHRLLAAGAAGLRRRAVPARQAEGPQRDAGDAGRGGRRGLRRRLQRRASAATPASRTATRWVEPLVPGNAAAPFHPNARGEAGVAVPVAAASS